MDLYTSTAYQLSEQLTKNYSTSFAISSRLFDKSIQRYIYAIYGLVRIADEIVDTYKGPDAGQQLSNLYNETLAAIDNGYSANPIVHAFALTAKKYKIDDLLIKPFFESMKSDLTKIKFDQKSYEIYIHGSAEVVGLMCLRVFVNNDKQYQRLKQGAESLGAAYQKVNFLRDIKADYQELGRVYFPGVDFQNFSESQKQSIIEDIEHDFKNAKTSIQQLPDCAKKAVTASYIYYQSLLQRLKKASVSEIKQNRLRVSNIKKAYLYIGVKLGAISLNAG